MSQSNQVGDEMEDMQLVSAPELTTKAESPEYFTDFKFPYYNTSVATSDVRNTPLVCGKSSPTAFHEGKEPRREQNDYSILEQLSDKISALREEQAAQKNFLSDTLPPILRFFQKSAESDRQTDFAAPVQVLFERLGASITGKFHQFIQEQHNESDELQSSRKTADSEIQSRWESLSYNIRCIAYTLTDRPLKGYNNFQKSHKTLLHQIYPQDVKFYDNCDLQHSAIQACIWQHLHCAIFQSGNDFRGSPVMDHLKKARSRLLESTRHNDDLRRIAIFFSKTHELSRFRVNDEKLNQFVNKEASFFLQFAVTSEDTRLRGQLRTMLESAVKTALEIDQTFLSSKALLRARWPADVGYEQGADLDGRSMEGKAGEVQSRSGKLKHPYLCSLSPFVQKQGNADGHNYEASLILCKADVVCGPVQH